MASVKDWMIHIIHNQPDDSSYDEILKKLAFHRMIEHGLYDLNKAEQFSIKRWSVELLHGRIEPDI